MFFHLHIFQFYININIFQPFKQHLLSHFQCSFFCCHAYVLIFLILEIQGLKTVSRNYPYLNSHALFNISVKVIVFFRKICIDQEKISVIFIFLSMSYTHDRFLHFPRAVL